MCGVIGFHSKDFSDENVARICRLFEESKVRGLHSFGASVRLKTGEIKTFKAFEVKEIVTWLRNLPEFDTLIGHTRYSTSGDWQDHVNNQPIVVDGVSVVFNGVITQAPKSEYEQVYGKKYITDNDGEIFARKVLDAEDWKEFVRAAQFSFAGIFMDNSGAYAIRNKNRPLWVTQQYGAIFLASTNDIFVRAGFADSVTRRPLDQGEALPLCAG